MSDKSAFKDFIVLNASPLIVLLKSELDYILPGMFDRIAVPNAVWHEVTVCDDKACKNLKEAMWAEKQTIEVNRRILVWNLGNGESEVLSWSLNHQEYVAVIDDMAARKCSKALNIRHIGTAGLLVLAYRRRLIHSLEHAFYKVKNAGLYLSNELTARLIKAEVRH